MPNTTKAKAAYDRLVEAINYHIANRPKSTDRRYAEELAIRFSVHPETMETALQMLAQNFGGQY